jgi:IS30 family transposase
MTMIADRPPAVEDRVEIGHRAGDSIMGGGNRSAIGTLVERRTRLTWDQGKEMALHEQVTRLTGTKVYFCDAHSPWQRGSNENMNGLLRDYFPRHTDLSTVTPEQLKQVSDEINARPRKTLDWARPADLLHAHHVTLSA